MSETTKLEVIDPDGWKKEYSLQKAVIFIGSDPNNDIPLGFEHGGGIAPRHIQLIAVPDEGYRLVNLSDTEVMVGQAGDHGIAPRLSTPLADGEQIKLGEFVLILRGEVWGSGVVAGQSRHIGLSLTLPETQLAPHQTLEGSVTVYNQGDFSGAQFDLDLEGFDTDCFEIEPGPLLSSRADKEASFRLYHRGHKPLAGDVTLTIRATAPTAYPGEQASVSRVIRVLPFFNYSLTLSAPAESQPARPPKTPAAAQPSGPDEQAETTGLWSPEAPAEPPPPKPEVKASPPSEADHAPAGPAETAPAADSYSPPVQPEPGKRVEPDALPVEPQQPPPAAAPTGRPPKKQGWVFPLFRRKSQQPTPAPTERETPPRVDLPPAPETQAAGPPQAVTAQAVPVEAEIMPDAEAQPMPAAVDLRPPVPPEETASPAEPAPAPAAALDESAPTEVGGDAPPRPEPEQPLPAESVELEAEIAQPEIEVESPQPKVEKEAEPVEAEEVDPQQAAPKPGRSADEAAVSPVEPASPTLEADLWTPAPAEDSTAATRDWWTAAPETEPSDQIPPEQRQKEQAEAEAEAKPPPSTDDLWSSAAEADKPPAAGAGEVVKLKAGRSAPEEKPEDTAGSPAPTEDWWATSPAEAEEISEESDSHRQDDTGE